MPLYDTLYPNERQIIIDWILDGAKDVFGQSPTLADFQPTTYGFIAYQNDTDGIRLDTIRADFVSPVQLPHLPMWNFGLEFMIPMKILFSKILQVMYRAPLKYLRMDYLIQV